MNEKLVSSAVKLKAVSKQTWKGVEAREPVKYVTPRTREICYSLVVAWLEQQEEFQTQEHGVTPQF